MFQNVPTYIPLNQAVDEFGVTEDALLQLIQTGRVEAIQLRSGELLVSAANGHYKTKEQIIEEEFSHLKGQTISVSDASRKYSKFYSISISKRNFSNWAEAGYIEIKDRGYRLQLNEADVAYCAKIYAEKHKEYEGQMAGVPVFDKKGNPYQLKYREVAEKLRAERRQQKKETFS